MKCPICSGDLIVEKTRTGKPMLRCEPCWMMCFVHGDNAIRKVFKRYSHRALKKKRSVGREKISRVRKRERETAHLLESPKNARRLLAAKGRAEVAA